MTKNVKTEDVKNKCSVSCCKVSAKVKEFIKESKNHKKCIASAVATVVVLIVLCAVFCKEKQVTYSYIADGYIKEVRQGNSVIERSWCQIDRKASVESTTHIFYKCQRTIQEIAK